MAQAQNDCRSRQCQIRHRSRLCLLKGCGKTFRPTHPLTRYCSVECQEEARRWQCARARKRYRRTNSGRVHRREQHRRYRKRCKERAKSASGYLSPSEGDQNTRTQKNFCSRPGCYQVVVLNKRSPLQKFCSKPCRCALQRVTQRERRWHERLHIEIHNTS